MSSTNINQLSFFNENDPVTLLSSNNYLDQLVPIIKTSLQTGTTKNLVEKLKAEATKKDDEIFSALNENEENIATSVQDIKHVSKEASVITDQVVDINDHLSKTSQLTIDKKFKLLELKKNISKINESEILISRILQVLELADKTQELIKANKFFNALKNLNDLNRINKDFDKDIKFLHHINDSIPLIRQLIQDESLGLLKRHLTTLDSKFEHFSEDYYDAYSSILERWDHYRAKYKEFDSFKVNSSVEISLRSSYIESPLPQSADLIDLDFIYDTVIVFKTLNHQQFLKNELNKELNIRRDRALHPFVPSESQNNSFKEFIKNTTNLKSFLGKLIGFLIFHYELSTKFPTLVNQTTNDQWESISAKVYPILKNVILNEIFEISKIIEIKKILGQYLLILENFSLSGDHFYNLLIITFKKYSSLAAFAFDKEFQVQATEDESMPMIIYEPPLYKKISHIVWFEERVPENQVEFPYAFPFSSIYAMTCAQVKKYIKDQETFLKDYFKYETPALNKLVIQNIDSLFINSLNKHFNQKVDSFTREELAQNLINLEYFIIMTKEVAKLLSTKFDTNVSLKSTEMITNTRKVTEGKLFEMVDGKIDDLSDTLEWDWDIQVTNSEPNYFVRDMGDFLINMFNSTFKNLPLSVRALLLYRVFDLLAARFFEDLMSVPSVSPASIHNFDLDIAYFENITDELAPEYSQAKPTGSSKESLKSMFTQLRQVINLLKSGCLEEYKDQTIRSRKYDQIKPEIAVQLMNKIDGSANSGSAPVTPTMNTSSASKIFSKFRHSGS